MFGVESTTAVASGGNRKRRVAHSPRDNVKRSKSSGLPTALPQFLPTSTACLLDLPQELLTEIFVLSGNASLPAACRYLYEALYANPRAGRSIDGPPLWLQRQFVRHMNPSLTFAIQKCLRRRFFGPETFKMFLPELVQNGCLTALSVPLRCVLHPSEATTTRELLLYTELFLNGIQLSENSRNKALVYLAAHCPIVESDSLFWKSTRHDEFTLQAISNAFLLAARRRFLEPHRGMFDHLVSRFGVSDDDAYQLYELAARKKDQALVGTLQRHGIRPGMAALKLLTLDT